jgi:hypothetical protein
VTSQGSLYGRFQRALKAGQVFHAETAARELGGLNLADALRLVELYAAYEPDKFERAAVRWYTRYLEEAGPTLLQAGIALAALGELRGRGEAAGKLLAELCREGGTAAAYARADPATPPG